VKWISINSIISTVVGLGIFIFIFYSETGQTPELQVHYPMLLTALVLFNLVGFGMHTLSRRYNGFLPWNRNIAARFFLEVSSGLVLLAMASFLFSIFFLSETQPTKDGTGFWDEYWDGAVKFGILSLVTIYIYSLLNFSIFSYNQYSVHQIDQLRDERNQINLQFEALKNQLSPHFLFNALNTISSLIYKDVLLAEDFIRRLAHTYRYILRTNDQRLINLGSELEMLRSYFFMQKIKYEACIEFRENIPESVLDTLIPPLTLQMLMENALKHNLVSDERKLVIELEVVNGDYLVIRNNLIPKTELLKIGNNLVDRPKAIKSHKIGLSNIRGRYAFFTTKQIDVSVNGDFMVRLPIIRKNIESA
jgi:hypothetical protein